MVGLGLLATLPDQGHRQQDCQHGERDGGVTQRHDETLGEVEGKQQGRHEGDEAGLGAALPVVLATGHLGHEVEQPQRHPEEGGGKCKIRKEVHRLVEGGPADQAADVGQQAVQGATGLDEGCLTEQPEDRHLPQHVEDERQS